LSLIPLANSFPESGSARTIKCSTESTSQSEGGAQNAGRKWSSRATKTGSRRLVLPMVGIGTERQQSSPTNRFGHCRAIARHVISQDGGLTKTRAASRSLDLCSAELASQNALSNTGELGVASHQNRGKKPSWGQQLLRHHIRPVAQELGHHEADWLAHVPQNVLHTAPRYRRRTQGYTTDAAFNDPRHPRHLYPGRDHGEARCANGRGIASRQQEGAEGGVKSVAQREWRSAVLEDAVPAPECVPFWYLFVPTPGWSHSCKYLNRNGGDDGTRTRGLCRDRSSSTYISNHLETVETHKNRPFGAVCPQVAPKLFDAINPNIGPMLRSPPKRWASCCHSPKLGRARLKRNKVFHYQPRSRVSGSSQRSISMEWC